jgi:hypothetical protein
MKTKLFTVVAALMICMGANAQDKASSLTIGFSPIGGVNVKMKQKDYDIDHKLDYKSAWNVNIGYERQFNGAVSLTELHYGQAKFDKATYNYKDVSNEYTSGDDIYSAGITTYIGTTINAKKRFQLPIFIGIGGEYIDGGDLHNVIFDGAAKARMKFYITNNFGIYAGGTFKYGFGMRSIKDDDKKSITITPITWAVDAGLIIGL